MMLKRSFRENKHVAAQMDAYDPLLEDAVYAFQHPAVVEQVLQALRTLAQAGLAIGLVEQNVRAAMAVVDRLVLIERGRMVLEGPAQAVGNDPRIADAYLGATAGHAT